MTEIGKKLFHVEPLPPGATVIWDDCPEGCVRVWGCVRVREKAEAGVTQEQERLWQEMADMTLAKCRQHCRQLGCCCSSEYCEMAAENMEKAGVSVADTMRTWPDSSQSFISPEGRCVVPPHFRPLCTLHQCKISGLGLDRDDPEWTKKYFEIREKLEEFSEGTLQ